MLCTHPARWRAATVLQLGGLWGSLPNTGCSWKHERLSLAVPLLGMQHLGRRLPGVSFCPGACSLYWGKSLAVVWLWKHKYTVVSVTIFVVKNTLRKSIKWPKLLFYQCFRQISVKGKASASMCEHLHVAGSLEWRWARRFLSQEPGWSTSMGRFREHDQVTPMGCFKMCSSGLCCSKP